MTIRGFAQWFDSPPNLSLFMPPQEVHEVIHFKCIKTTESFDT
jgi:hypothetical protein